MIETLQVNWRSFGALVGIAMAWAVVSACPASVPDRIRVSVAAETVSVAYDADATVEFVNRLNFYRSLDPYGADGVGPGIEERIKWAEDAGELIPVCENGRPPGARVNLRKIIHPEKGVVFGRIGREDDVIFGLGPGEDGNIDASEIDSSKDPRVLDALESYEFAELMGTCQRGACPIDINTPGISSFWIAVRLVDGREYVAGWFPDWDIGDTDYQPSPLFDAWATEIDARWGVAK